MRPKYNDAGERQQALARRARPIAKARLNSNVVFVLEGGYVLPTGDVDGLDYVSFAFGLQYRF